MNFNHNALIINTTDTFVGLVSVAVPASLVVNV